ncbi:MAG: glycosyltransferase family 2 protein [Bacteroidales bacterium]|nr:glycosyltransferase family 2 protein [Bacteroidales bacterium]
MKTAIVILNWNGEKYLKKFLAPILRSVQDNDAEVIVADNNSTDGSVSYIENSFEGRIRTLCLDKNYGFAEGYNKALQQIDAQYYLLLNSDVWVDSHWLDALEEWMDLHPDCAVCGPKILSYDRQDEFEYAGAAGGLIDILGYSFCRGRIMSYIEKDRGQYEMPEDTFWQSGACMMVRSSVWRELGGFDKDYFAHFEEIDFCWRAKLAHYRVCYVPRSHVYHVGGGTLPQDSPWKLKLNYRNNLLTLHKNYAKTIALRDLFELIATLVKSSDFCGINEWECCLRLYEELPAELQQELLENAAKEGINSRKRIILKRRFLDFLSACVYLVSGKTAAFKAVFQAHREFDMLKKTHAQESTESLYNYLQKSLQEDFIHKFLQLDLENGFGKKVSIKGVSSHWIIPYAYRYKEKVHDRINKEIKL